MLMLISGNFYYHNIGKSDTLNSDKDRKREREEEYFSHKYVCVYVYMFPSQYIKSEKERERKKSQINSSPRAMGEMERNLIISLSLSFRVVN